MSKKWERARDAPVSTQGCCLNRKDHFRLLSLESLMGTLGLIGEERGFPAQRGKVVRPAISTKVPLGKTCDGQTKL